MRSWKFLAVPLLAALALTGCSLFDSDDKDEGLFQGSVIVGLTDQVPASGTYTIRNAFLPNIPEILAIVQIENARPGMQVEGRWYQLGTVQQRAPNIGPEGALISQAGFTLAQDSITPDGRGGGRLRLVPNAPLPVDSYVLRVYVDGKLARTAAFIVVQPATNAPATAPTPAAPAPTATPPR